MSLTRRVLCAASLLLTAATSAFAAFPDRPLQLILPYPPGGAADVLGRILAKELETKIGQPVIVVNKPGAGTIIAAQAAATAPADGYTLFLTSNSTFTLNPAVQPNLPYDSARDFEPVAMVSTIALSILTPADTPTPDLKSLIAAAKANPDKLNMASFGNATASHFGGEMFKAAAGIAMTHVPYKGSGPQMTDLIGKQVNAAVDTVVAALPQIKSGKIRALAVTTAKRSALLPDVPTIAESGFAGFDFSSWVAIVTPKGVPADAKAAITKALDAVMADKAIQDKLTASGFEPAYGPIADWPGFIAKDIAAMKTIANKAAIKAD